MSKFESQIDYKSLEIELKEALKADELYKLQNDAKLRAVEQKVPTYEHFRQMVNGAHLKPLERGDIKSKVGVSWNPVTANENTESSIMSHKSKRDETDVTKCGIPKTYEEFIWTWERIKGNEGKFIYLTNIRHVLQEKIFRVEIPPILFNELVTICLENIEPIKNIQTIIEILQILPKCNRFQLTLSFMSQIEQTNCSRLFDELLIKAEHLNKCLEGTIKLLAATYNVKLS